MLLILSQSMSLLHLPVSQMGAVLLVVIAKSLKGHVDQLAYVLKYQWLAIKYILLFVDVMVSLIPMPAGLQKPELALPMTANANDS